MGKRKKSRRPNKFSKSKVSEGLGSAYNDGYQSIVDTSSRDYIYDEVDRYHDDINKADLDEALNIMKVKRAKKENVLSLGMDSSDNEDQDEDVDESESDESDVQPFVADDDIVEQQEEKVPDDRAWGKDRNLYYGTNVTDQKIRKRATHLHLNEVHDVAMLELEANRARQKRMEESLAGFDPTDILAFGDDAVSEPSSTQVSVMPQSASSLGMQEQVKLLKKLSPEFIPLTNDMLDKLQECECLLEPLLSALSRGRLGRCAGMDYALTKWRLSKNYSLCVMSYVYLVAQKGHDAVKSHRVMEKLVKYRYLFQELKPVDDVMKSQLETLLYRLNNNLPLNLIHPPSPDRRMSSDNFTNKNNNHTSSLFLQTKSKDNCMTIASNNSSHSRQAKPADAQVGLAASGRVMRPAAALTGVSRRGDSVMWKGKKLFWDKMDPSLKAFIEKQLALAELKRRQASIGTRQLLIPHSTTSGGQVSSHQQEDVDEEEDEQLPSKKARVEGADDESDTDSDEDAVGLPPSVPADGEAELSDGERRPIGRDITKNKGLIPRRKKELKNPRIKYKVKYGEKLKRRKGQVRNVLPVIPSYTGEKSGINAYAIKSKRFK